jgi:hypothetical protein
MKFIHFLILSLLLVGCTKSDVPKTQFENRMLNAVLQEATKRDVSVPRPYSFFVGQATMTPEFGESKKVWTVEVFPKTHAHDFVIAAIVDPTNYEVLSFSTFTSD